VTVRAATTPPHAMEIASNLRVLWARRELIWLLVLRDLKLRYQGSLLGFMWSLLVPLVQILVLTIVFRRFMRLDIPNYSVFVFCAYVPWIVFQTVLGDSCKSLLEQRDLVRKVRFPHEALPIATLAGGVIHFLLYLAVLLAVLACIPVHFFPTLLLIPLLILIQAALMMGLGFLFSCLQVYYHDIAYGVQVLLMVWFWLTPIVYPRKAVPEKYLFWYDLNPMTAIVGGFRRAVLPTPELIQAAPWELIAQAAAISLLVLIVGYLVFRWRSWHLPEVL